MARDILEDAALVADMVDLLELDDLGFAQNLEREDVLFLFFAGVYGLDQTDAGECTYGGEGRGQRRGLLAGFCGKAPQEKGSGGFGRIPVPSVLIMRKSCEESFLSVRGPWPAFWWPFPLVKRLFMRAKTPSCGRSSLPIEAVFARATLAMSLAICGRRLKV